MKKTGDYSIRRQTIRTFIVMAITLIPVSAAMIFAGIQFTRSREQFQMKLKENTLAALVVGENERLASAEALFDRNLSAHLRAMTALLGELVTEEGYIGPYVLSDGFVVTLRGSEVIVPEGIPEGRMELTRALINRSLATGRMRTGRFQSDAPLPETGADSENPSNSFFLSFAAITKNLVYVHMTSEAGYEANISQFVSGNITAIEGGNGGFGGVTLLVGEGDGSAELLRAYGDLGSIESLTDAGLMPEQILKRASVLSLNGRAYSCTYSTLQGKWEGWEDPVIVQMLPMATIGMRSVMLSLIILYAMALIPLNMVVYVMSVQRYVRENVVTEEQAARYRPRKLRMRMVNAGVIGAGAILVLAMITQGVGQLYIELKYGRDTLSMFSKQIEQVDQERSNAQKKLQEDWYVYFGEQMAGLIADYPQLATPETLQTCCDILDVDYIMLFDDQGSETLCSRDYIGLTLDRAFGRNASDFRRLLYGMPSIVHEPETDAITGLERQMIGVKLPLSESSTRHGALVMALLPEQTRQTAEFSRVNEYLSVVAVDGTLYFSADAASGTIRHASEASMVGQGVEECGLSAASLRDGYMDFEVIDGTRYFILTSKYGESIFYYAFSFSEMFNRVMVFGVMAALMLAVATTIIMGFAFRGYDDAIFDRWAVVRMSGETSEDAHLRQAQARLESHGGAEAPGSAAADGSTARKPGLFRAMLVRLAEAAQWESKLPEEKVSLVFKASLIVLLLSWANLLLSKNIAYRKFDSLAGFLLQGDWMRGANLFSFCSIFLVIAYAYLINVVSRAALMIASSFLLGKGQTFCRLLHSFVKYFSLFVVLYLMLHYLGFPIGTVVGSLSITTLALSLGAKDLAADILAGLSIVFEKTFQVGDIIEINGQRGRVEEIGVRTTKIIVPVNNVLIISNHQIQDVLNLTREISRHTLELKVMASLPLEHLEALLRRELPMIQRRNEKIITLEYMGVTEMGSKIGLPDTSTMTLAIGAYCLQGDMWDVRLYLNREIKLLCEREGIEIK